MKKNKCQFGRDDPLCVREIEDSDFRYRVRGNICVHCNNRVGRMGRKNIDKGFNFDDFFNQVAQNIRLKSSLKS